MFVISAIRSRLEEFKEKSKTKTRFIYIDTRKLSNTIYTTQSHFFSHCYCLVKLDPGANLQPTTSTPLKVPSNFLLKCPSMVEQASKDNQKGTR